MKKLFYAVVVLALSFTSCSDDENVTVTNAGTLSGGPFTFFVDGKVDNVSGIVIDDNIQGSNTSFIITDDAGKILGLPSTLTALEGVDFDGAGVGKCYIWYIAYENDLQGLEADKNANDLSGNFDLSNKIEVNREGGPVAGTLEGGPFTFIAGDGVVDNVSGITVAGTPAGTNSSFIITDDAGKILGLPGDKAALEGVNLDGAGVGKCLIWYIRYEGEAADIGLEADKNANDLEGIFSLSNSIEVNRVAAPEAGTLVGGPFNFLVGDGVVDNVSGISVTGMSVGTNSSYIITDDTGKILGLPPTLAALEGVDLDGAGNGVCLIWYVRYEGEAADIGLETDKNANNLTGIFDLSNSITVNRTAAAKLTVDVSGLENLGDDFKYEGWIIVGGAPVTTGVFSVDDSGVLSSKEFFVDPTMLAAATKFVLSIEPTVDPDPAPADTKLLVGDFSGNTAAVSSVGMVGDFSASTGKYILATPTDTDATNEFSGVWFLDNSGMAPVAGLNLPTLPAGWKYEGWVVLGGTPVSTGTFVDLAAADDNAATSPYKGADNNGPGYPGEDYVTGSAAGVTFPTDLRGSTVVISVEPSPDNSAAPFALKPLAHGVPAMAADHTVIDMGAGPVQSISGTVTR